MLLPPGREQQQRATVAAGEAIWAGGSAVGYLLGSSGGGQPSASAPARAAPRAPAMSRSGTSAKVTRGRCSARRSVFSLTVARNQSQKSGVVSTTPPPDRK